MTAENHAPDLNTQFQQLRSQKLCREVDPQIAGEIPNPQQLLASMTITRHDEVHTANAFRHRLTVYAAGPSERATKAALEQLIDALAREPARTQPPLQNLALPLQDPVPYHIVTGSKEKLYRSIEQ